MRRPANLLFLALLIAALGAALVYRYLRGQQEELEEARERALGSIVQVVVADELIPIGTRIKESQIKLVRWPKDAEPDGALSKTDAAVNRVARVTIQKNQPLVSAQLVTEAAGLLPLLIPEGRRAISVKVDRVTGVSGFITPNSVVDVLAAGTVESAAGDREDRGKLILQNIRVLAIGTSIEQQEDGAVEVPTVTLLVTPDEAEKLTLATRRDPVRLALRNYRDVSDVATPGISMQELFGRSGRPIQNGKRAPARPSMEILLGETRTRQSY
jgi:pilus assembly protein CpaB